MATDENSQTGSNSGYPKMIPIRLTLLYNERGSYSGRMLDINPNAIISLREVRELRHVIPDFPDMPTRWTIVAVPGAVYEVMETIEVVRARLAGEPDPEPEKRSAQTPNEA